MLEGKTILITGSSRGIGAATARLAKKYGASVVVHGKTDSEDLKKITEELGAEKMVCDLTDQKAVFAEVKKILGKVGKIDGLANVAGAVNPKPFLEATEEDWLWSYKTNVLSVVYMSQVLIPHMQKNKKGAVVNVGSVRAYPQGTLALRAPYSSAKASVNNLSVAMAKEYAKDGIRINSVSPGGVNTDISKTWDEETKARNTNVLLKRLGEPEEVAEMICFLLSDRASYMTGNDYLVDGGYLVNR